MNMIKLENIGTEKVPGGVRKSARLASDDLGESPIWIELNSDNLDFQQDRGDPFLWPAVLFAMRHRSTLEIDCKISVDLAANLPDIVRIFSTMLDLPEIDVHITDTEYEPLSKNQGVLTGLSGGVDSFHILSDYYLDCQWPSRKITHLTFNDVGSHGTGDYHRVALERRDRVRRVASELCLPLFEIRSNFADLLELDFQQTHTARNVSAAYMFATECSTFMYATSGNGLSDTGIYKSQDMAHADLILLPLFSTDQMRCLSPDARHLRSDKIARICSHKIVQENLDVCQMLVPTGDKINCSHCPKCIRTMITLEYLGHLQDFEKVFHIDHYEKNKDWMVRALVGSKVNLDKDALNLAMKAGLAENWRTQLKLKAPWLARLKPGN